MVESSRTLDVSTFKNRYVETTYPNFELIGDINECIPLVTSLLREGDIMLFISYKGEKKVVRSISPTAYNIDKLLRVSKGIRINKSETEFQDIHKISDYMEALKWISLL